MLKLKSLVPLLPSVAETFAMLILGGSAGWASSLRIVPMPWLSAITALAGSNRLTWKFSSPSNLVSPNTLTTTCLLVWPGVKVSVPEVSS